jgi:hypothetical protein
VPAPAPVPPPFKAAPPGNAPYQATVPRKAPPPPPSTGPAAVPAHAPVPAPAPGPGPALAPAPAGEWQHGAWQQGWDQGWREGWTWREGWDQGWDEGWLAPGPVEPAAALPLPLDLTPAGPDRFEVDAHVMVVNTDRAGDYGRIHSYKGAWFNVRMDMDGTLRSFYAANLAAAAYGPGLPTAAPGPGIAPPPFKAPAPGPGLATAAASVRTTYGSDPLFPRPAVPKTAQWLGGLID